MPALSRRDTVVALSSPPGASARAVLRLSGPRAHELGRTLFRPWPVAAWRYQRGVLRLSGWPEIPSAALTFRAPRSYSGEDMVELWLPGAPPLLRRLLLNLQASGARLAKPGEFTRRAFLCGRLDLTQAEAILALTRSEDDALRQAALRALAGGVSDRVEEAKQRLLGVLAQLEAALDFGDDELDLAPDSLLAEELCAVRKGLSELRGATGQRPQAGTLPVVALVGPSNAGKSTLFNRLIGRSAALVSSEEGTTRDVLEGLWRLPGGSRVRLLDTAGHKVPSDGVEELALQVAQRAAESAHLVLRVQDPAFPAVASLQGGELLLWSKQDLWAEGAPPREGLCVSAHSDQGLDALGAAVRAKLFRSTATSPDLVGSARQDELLRVALVALARAAEVLEGDDAARVELSAFELGEALESLGQLTGTVTSDDLLERIFSSFCVGK